VAIRPLFGARQNSAMARRLTDPGWLLLPLRAFLGITFSYAGLQKLANPAYLDPHNPTSVAGQMRLLRHSSPIGALVDASTHAPTLVGLLIAFGELAVGVGTLTAFYFRLAALGGALLSMTFFLTVSWNTTPYYYGSDIVFVFAWLTMLAFGDTGVLSLQTWVARRARRLPPRGRGVRRPSAVELDRRAVVQTGLAAVLLGGATLALGGITAAWGRAAGGTRGNKAAESTPLAAPPSSGPPLSGQAPTSPSATSGGGGTDVGASADIPVGQAKSFTDPSSGEPAWVVHPSASTFVAFSAVCTHAGCPVQYDASNVQFICPCHGGVYDARTGAVLQGPPPGPLPSIPVRVVDGQLQVNL
jgi:thiosulfate dehydrogenase (quinone) large subunit